MQRRRTSRVAPCAASIERRSPRSKHCVCCIAPLTRRRVTLASLARGRTRRRLGSRSRSRSGQQARTPHQQPWTRHGVRYTCYRDMTCARRPTAQSIGGAAEMLCHAFRQKGRGLTLAALELDGVAPLLRLVPQHHPALAVVLRRRHQPRHHHTRLRRQDLLRLRLRLRLAGPSGPAEACIRAVWTPGIQGARPEVSGKTGKIDKSRGK